MLQKRDIETILKINGVSLEAHDDEVRSVLLSSRYRSDEIDVAIMTLRGNNQECSQKTNSLHKIFRSDEGLSPAEISSLLGIEVKINTVTPRRSQETELSALQSIAVAFFATVLAVAGVFLAMYFYKVGFFHPTIPIANASLCQVQLS